MTDIDNHKLDMRTKTQVAIDLAIELIEELDSQLQTYTDVDRIRDMAVDSTRLMLLEVADREQELRYKIGVANEPADTPINQVLFDQLNKTAHHAPDAQQLPESNVLLSRLLDRIEGEQGATAKLYADERAQAVHEYQSCGEYE